MSYKVAQQQQLKASLQQIPQIHRPSRPRQSHTSQYLTSYRNFLRNAQNIPKQELITQLEKHSFVYSQQTFEETFKIQVKSFVYNLEIFEVTITYASFTGLLQVINIDRESPLNSTCDSASGGYGKIYKLASQGRTYATKCITYSEASFQQNFSNAVIECFLLKIASALEVGPCMQSPLGFDIVVYRNCLEFSMELCQYKQGQYLQKDLKTALHKLHTMRIIHYDIKPQNINYSQIFERYIFIDFGLSKIIQQDVGQKTWSQFRGSLVYCNSQMQAAYIDSQPKLIDLYYNDAQCLNKSLTNLQQRLQLCEIQKNPNEEISDMTEIYQITKLKWRIYIVSRKDSCHNKIESILKDPLINKHIAYVNQFLNNLPEEVQLFARFQDRLWSLTDRQQRNQRSFIIPKLKQQDFFNDSESGILKQRFKQINTLNSQNLTFKCVDSSDLQEKILKQIENSMFSSKQVYYLKVLDVLRVQDNNYPMNLKQKVARDFVMNEIKPDLKEEFAIKASLLFMLQHFFNYRHNKCSCLMLYNLLCSLFFYEAIQEADAARILKQFLYLEMDLSTKLRLAFRFLISIRWIQGKYQSIYDYERLQSEYWMIIKTFLQKVSVKGMSHQQRLYYSIISNIIQQPLSKTNRVQINFIIRKHKFESLMTLDKRFLKDLYLYIIQREFQHTSQNGGYIFDSTLQRYLKLASDYSKKCQISMCLFSRVHLYNFNYRKIKLIQTYLYDIDIIACNYPQLKYYTFYVCYQLHRFQIGRQYEENIIQLMQNITQSSKYIKKLQLFSELLKIYTIKKKQNEYEDFFMSGHTLKFALKTINQSVNAIKTCEFPSYLRHKHNLIRLAQCLLVNFNFIIQFKILQRPVIGNTITNFVQDFVNLVNHSECIACKYKSLMLIANLWANRQLIFNNTQNAQRIIVSHIAQNIKMNQHVLDNISAFINFQCGKIQTNSKNLIVMFYEFINLSKCYDYFFEKEWVGQQRLSEVYQYLFENQMHEELINIVEVIINYIHCNSFRHYFKILFRAIYNIIECMPNKQAQQQFYNNHTYIFAHFKQKRFNPFIIFYLFVVSLSNHQKGRDNYLFYLIAKSINFYSYWCSQLVQSFYYPRFINHMNYSPRKRHFLTKKTYNRSIIENKLSFSQFSYDFKKRKNYSYRSQKGKALDFTLKKYFICIFPHNYQPRFKSSKDLYEINNNEGFTQI